MNKIIFLTFIALLFSLKAYAFMSTGYTVPDYEYYYTENDDGKIRCFRVMDKKNNGLEAVLSFSKEFEIAKSNKKKTRTLFRVNKKTIIRIITKASPRNPVIDVDDDERNNGLRKDITILKRKGGGMIVVDDDYKPRGPIINVDNDFKPARNLANIKKEDDKLIR